MGLLFDNRTAMTTQRLFFVAVCVVGFDIPHLWGQDDVPPDKNPLPNISAKTLGGTQFWSDVLVYHQWRIQQNTTFGQYRLLDDKNVRRVGGSYQRCHNEFERLKDKLELPPPQGKAVVVLHGLGRTRDAMDKLCHYLTDEGGYTVINVTYASTRQSIGEHAANLARIINRLDQVEEINFVAHSMGNLVIRHYLGDQTDPAAQKQPDHRIKRIVMLGPPNQGSRLADLLQENYLFRLFCGVSGQELSSGWEKLSAGLATPTCEFAIIAGGRGKSGRNPLLHGDDDLIVSVAETRLAGAADFATLSVLHTFLMDDPTVHEYTLRFLQHGYLISREKRSPISAENTQVGKD